MIKITIKTDNAAFSDGRTELARILRDLADRFENSRALIVRDVNGNTCGSVTLTGKDRA